MKKFLLLSHYAPKPGFKYPEHDCPLAHRETAHKRIYDLERFWPEGVLWRTVEVENTSKQDLLALVNDDTWDGVWLSGSPYLMHEADVHPWISHSVAATQALLTEKQNPVVGLCFGLQLLATAVGGAVKPTDQYIIGETDILDERNEKIVRTKAYHENYVTDLPSTAQVKGYTEAGLPYLVEFSEKVLGVQSHPECALKSSEEMELSEIFWQKRFQALIG